jgi:hypothetical protein
VAGSPTEKNKKHATSDPNSHKWLENLGLIVIVVLIVAITIIRYWHNIHWSAR